MTPLYSIRGVIPTGTDTVVARFLETTPYIEKSPVENKLLKLIT
jgi:hypothetical protein